MSEDEMVTAFHESLEAETAKVLQGDLTDSARENLVSFQRGLAERRGTEPGAGTSAFDDLLVTHQAQGRSFSLAIEELEAKTKELHSLERDHHLCLVALAVATQLWWHRVVGLTMTAAGVVLLAVAYGFGLEQLGGTGWAVAASGTAVQALATFLPLPESEAGAELR